MPAITKRLVDALQPSPDREVFVWDQALIGFGLRMMPSGRGSYLIQWRTPEGKTRRLAIGKVGTLTPDQARKIAREKLTSVASGSDPSAERRAARDALTVAELAQSYLEAAQAGLVVTRFRRAKKASTVAIDVGRCARHIVPLIGSERADRLTQAGVQRMADAIAAGKTAVAVRTKARGVARVTGGPGTAARVVELLGGMLAWGQKRGLLPVGPNPAHGIEVMKGPPSDRVLTDGELRALGAAIDDAFAVTPDAACVTRLIALTGLRLSEAAGLRWSEIDAPSNCLRLEETKTGRSIRPVGPTVLAFLQSLPRRHEDWVFPNRSKTGPIDPKKTIARLFNQAGMRDARAHDLRRTFASTAANLGYGDATIAELLGHSARGVTARHYIRRADAALVSASEASARFIVALLDRAEISTNTVVPFTRIG
ncbi:MAG: site-specific integrase [Alphaproteobacteria bacterium]|nr:site-specific integrase [Alphaproteobacteria bacterium]